ncbi:MAG: hypothetical protein AAFX93_00605 [Verrucomicrobiota bacterium]
MSVIYKIERQLLLQEGFLEQVVYPNDELNCFWTDDWTPETYECLAQAGFITISYPSGPDGPILISQLHETYSVLDWANLSIERGLRKLIKSGQLEEDCLQLVIHSDPSPICNAIQRYHQDDCWLTDEYADLMLSLANQDRLIRTLGIGLYDGKRNQLVGGEIGYTIGATYTSLSGFLDREYPKRNNLGKLQLVALARLLERCGYPFWNLGMLLDYKLQIGATETPRLGFLMRWLKAINQQAREPLDQLLDKPISCSDLLTKDSHVS